jgi:hypothetical protein
LNPLIWSQGRHFRKGAPKSKNQKIFFSTKYIKWILPGKEKLRETRSKYFQIDLSKRKKVIEKMRKKHSHFLGF